MTTVATVGADVPRQLVLAAGAVPRRLTGLGAAGDLDEELLAEAGGLLGAVDGAAVRILAELLGIHEGVAMVVISNDSEACLRIFYVLRMLRAARRGLPPVLLLDAQRLDRPAARRFTRGRLARLAGELEEATGAVLDSAALGRAAAEERGLGAALDALRVARRLDPPAVSGSEAAWLLTGARSLPPARAAAAIRTLLAGKAQDDSDAARPVARAPRVVLTGSAPSGPAVIERLESGGLSVVADDHTTGDAEWLGEAVDGDLDAVLDGLAAAIARRPPSPAKGFLAERTTSVVSLARDVDADAVIALARVGDEAPLWDAADQREAVQEQGQVFIGPLGLDRDDRLIDPAPSAADLAGR